MSCLTLLAVKRLNAQSTPALEVHILFPTNNTFFNVSIQGVDIQLEYTTNNTLSWAGYSVDGGANVTCTGNTTDYTEYNSIQRSGSNTLTLYANDTAGNWATPQTVTYIVNYYADTYYATTPSSTPAVPELSWFIIVPLLLSIFSVVMMLKYRKTENPAYE